MTTRNHKLGGPGKPADDAKPPLKIKYRVVCPSCRFTFLTVVPFSYVCPRCEYNNAVKGEQVVKDV